MRNAPPDLDDARRRIAAADLVAAATNHLTSDLYVHLEFSDLVATKTLLKRFFSAQPWSDEDAEKLSTILLRNVPEPSGWFEHDLGSGLVLAHGFDDGVYRLWASGGTGDEASIFDRVFSGPVQPEATPNPRHVRFVLGGVPAPGVWYRAGDDVDDSGAAALLADKDVTDVLVAGDFVAVGLRRAAMWEDRLDDLVSTVTELFWTPDRSVTELEGPTRDQLVAGQDGGDLHLLNPDDPDSRRRLQAALGAILGDGEEVLLPDPVYDVYRSQIVMAGGRPRPVRATAAAAVSSHEDSMPRTSSPTPALDPTPSGLIAPRRGARRAGTAPTPHRDCSTVSGAR